METYILLENLRLYAYHGVGEQERIVGNHYLINLKVKVDITSAVKSDNLTDTISYADVFEIVKKEMAISSQLLEHVAGRIVSALRKEYSQIEDIEIKISKNNPPMGADLDFASILLIDKK